MAAQAPTTDQIRDAWDAIAPRFDEFATPATMEFARDVLRHLDIGPGTHFLDVAAGSGGLSIPAARLGADVVATDIAPTMIERLAARARAEGLATVEGRVMDGCALDLPDDRFDVAASMNGVSLFPDLTGGLAELVRVTRPGGQVALIAFGTLEKAEFIAYFVGALRAAIPGFDGLPTDPPPLPFQVADPAVMRARLADAGLSQPRVHTVSVPMTIRSVDHHWDVFTGSNPIGAGLVAELTPEQTVDVRRVLDGMLRERSGGGPGATLTAEMNIGIGTK